MNKCPRCKNEKIREGQNFCQICGLRLEELSKKQVIECLEKLKDQYECIYGDEFTFEISCLEYAINELERTAQEVPVQEQSKFISKCPICSYQNELITSKCVNPSFCMNCGGKTTYQNIPLL